MDDGTTFPLVDGRRSTSATGRAVVADAVRAVAPTAAAAVAGERDWRRGYLEHVRVMSALAATEPGAAVAISTAGLAAVHERFRFRTGGDDHPLRASLRAGLESFRRTPALFTATVTGSGPPRPPGLSVPYRGARLTGDALRQRLDRWLRDGVAEPSFATAVEAVLAQPEWLDLRGATVVVLGAGAELGPVVSLLRWGAHVVAVDLPGYAGWRRLIDTARQSPGRLTVPVRHWLPSGAGDDEIATAAGVDVITQTPQLFGWLAGIEGPYTLGNYVYADGAVHVLASVAIDALIAELAELRPDLSLAFLATPTDVFCVPAEAVEASRQAYRRRPWLRRAGRALTAGHLYAPNYPGLITRADGRPAGLHDALVPQQGPNYALAKRIQRWRALHERAGGRLVSVNIAPATRTRSVLRNRLLAAGYAGAHRFGVEVFDPSTSNTLMAALLAHDLRNPDAPANPAVRLDHPLDLFASQAMHGGLWRIPYAPRSVLGVAVALGMVQRGA